MHLITTGSDEAFWYQSSWHSIRIHWQWLFWSPAMIVIITEFVEIQVPWNLRFGSILDVPPIFDFDRCKLMNYVQGSTANIDDHTSLYTSLPIRVLVFTSDCKRCIRWSDRGSLGRRHSWDFSSSNYSERKVEKVSNRKIPWNGKDSVERPSCFATEARGISKFEKAFDVDNRITESISEAFHASE